MTAWVALLDTPEGVAAAAVSGHPEGPRWLCRWDEGQRPHPQALRVDPALVGPDGPACRVSLLLLASHARPIADDPAVVQCRRDVLRDLRLGGSSLLTDDPVHVAGTLVCAREDRPDQVQALADDPYRRLGRPLLLAVAAGLFTPHPPAVGPVVERYAGAPWPDGHW